MTSAINANLPRNADATSQAEIRRNFLTAKTEISDLQAGESFGAVGALAATSSTQVGGLAVTQVFNVITTSTASSAEAVTLPTFESGKVMVVHNASANTINVFPPSGGSINGGSANASVSVAAGKSRIFYGTSATAIYSLLGA